MKKAILLMVIFMHTLGYAGEEILNNGVQYKSIKRDYTGTVSLVIMIKGGVFRETAANNGIGSLFSSVWLKSGKLLEKAEFLGASASSSVTNDFFEFSFSSTSDTFGKLLTELKGEFLTPQFKKTVFNTEKELLLMELEAEKDDPNALAFQNFFAATYPAHPYSLKGSGTPQSVSSLKLSDMQDYYKSVFYGADMTAVLVGRFTPEEEKAVKEVLSVFPKGKPLNVDCSAANIKSITSSQDEDTRIQQAKLFLAYAAPAASSKDFAAAKLLSELLGGGMSSRYFTALRKEKGYAYAVSSMYPSRLCESRLIGYIGLAPENIDDAVKTIQYLNKTVTEGLTEGDILKAKNHIIGALLSDIETNARLAWYIAFFKNLGLGFDHLDAYIAQLKGISKKDLEKLLILFDKPYTLYVYKPVEKRG
ncbi:MAG: insulinase family protein [Deferribacteraceae bacterium]|jgi:predicted Zn-dependent peptidase|nr:insulinase family protein [Deferribacteraceae bacterium]